MTNDTQTIQPKGRAGQDEKEVKGQRRQLKKGAGGKMGGEKGVPLERHGMSGSPEYAVWFSMKARCANPNNASYSRYGGRGITVCAAWWNSFAQFFRDIGPRPSSRHTLNRKDNDGNYQPDNCEWTTWTEQQRNRSNNWMLTYNGVSMTVAAWAEKIGERWDLIYDRLERGWSIERTLTEKNHAKRRQHR